MTRLVVLLAFLFVAGPASAVNLGGTEVAREDFVFFIIIGHSNTTYTPGGDQAIHPRVWAYKTDGWVPAQAPLNQQSYGADWCGPGMHLGKELAELYPNHYVGILQNGITQEPRARDYWRGAVFRGETMGDDTIDMARAAMADATLGGVITMLSLGEAVDVPRAETFLADYTRLVAEFREDLGRPELPFLTETFYTEAPAVTEEIHFPQEASDLVASQIQLIPAQVPHTAIVDYSPPREAYLWDQWKMHFDRANQAIWGERAAAIIDAEGWFVGDSTPVLIAPTVTTQPTHKTVHEGDTVTFSVTASGSAPLAYQWLRDDVEIPSATSPSYEMASVTLDDDGAILHCEVSNAAGVTTSDQATLTVLAEDVVITNRPPWVTAGADIVTTPGSGVVLSGEVVDDGLPNGTVTVIWSQVSGPEDAVIDNPATPETTASFGQPGTYVLQLDASDGELSSHDQVHVQLLEHATIELSRPNGGEVWEPGSVQRIRWSAVGVEDVTIRYSVDDGATWEVIEWSIDTTRESWGDYPWEVPDTPSSLCRVSLSAYIAVAGGETESATTFEIATLPIDGVDGTIVGATCQQVNSLPVTLSLCLILLGRRRRRPHDDSTLR